LTGIEKRSDAGETLDAEVRDFLLQSLDVRKKTWKLNLDVLEAEMPKIVGFPTLNASFDGPTLFLSGADSDYVQTAHRPAIKALFPAARFAKINGAGHWLHAQKPRAFEATVRTFLTA
jgi:pimeloyl-ACP methyl ester carboxylesterase